MTHTKAKRGYHPHAAENQRTIKHFRRDILLALAILVFAKVGNSLSLVSEQIVVMFAVLVICTLVWRLCTLGAALFWENIIVDRIHEYQLLNKGKREERGEGLPLNDEPLEDAEDEIEYYREIEHAASKSIHN